MQNAYEKSAMLITAWHEAVNQRDLVAAQKLVTDPVEVAGPRGIQRITAAEFADWITTSGIRMRPLSTHPVDDATAVVEQEATWPGSDAARVATLFRTRDGAISSISRFASLDEALRAARP
ncbi:hypothetical protein OHA21_11690 [Actinoplanes sp. NBC_00393]|uniref:hypothetical protein n=1 Tax=Actinoplanes sp. NBC_00393 TaxID=2975953 RepID=UPI002E20A42F